MTEEKQSDEQKICPCKRVKCPRHGDCEACRAHHAGSKRPRPCEKERGRKRGIR